ncbi:MAG TPA: C25 family cysteine peptidase, partial [Actinomycetota bacterium]|nr:C25 family cysteine peptidase [Actinomycetota bacterium]
MLPPDPLDPILGDVGNDGPPIVGSGIDSLILVHSRRLAAVFGPVEAARILSELADLEEAAPTLGFNAQVVDLALFRTVEVAYAAADADPCSTDLANDVVRAINDAVDGLATPLNDHLADLRWITLVGDDDLIPHARLRDGTTIGNERGFAGDTFFADPTTGEARSNQYSAAFASGHYLSDAPYGSFQPVSIFGQTIYPMQVAVGRLGGSASTITNAIRLFVASGGVADPETATPRPALVGDYDFATDGGDRIEAALAADGLAARRLRGAWTREALTEALFGGGDAPDVIAVNAHYDQYRLLPGAGDAGTWTDEDLFTTADVAAAASDSFQLRVLFGIGCHFGLGFPDRLAGSTPSATDAARVLDWQQAYVDKGAAALIANLGYGYGDISAVGYSEQLMAALADNLADSPSIGEALTLSERDYLLSMGSFSAYDIKTMQQAILWGLPMYRLSSGPLGPAPEASPADAPALTDAGPFDTVTVDITPTFEDVLAPGGHVYRRVTGNDVSCSTSCVAEPDEGVQVTHPYPIVPRSVVRLPATDGASARGAVMLGVPVGDAITPTTPRTEIEATNLDIAYARATIDSSTIDPVRTAPGIYPATPQAITTFIDRDGTAEQRLVVLPGQYRPASGSEPGIFRTFVTSRWLVTYSADGDTTPPQIVEVVADPVAGRTRFSVTVHDPGNGDAEPVLRVGVNALPLGGADPNVYRLLDLEPDAAVDGRWVGTMPFNVREFVVFAIDSHGNVANATNAGAAYAAVDEEPPTVALAIGTPKVSGADGRVIVRASTPLSVTVGDDGTGVSACTIEISGGGTA